MKPLEMTEPEINTGITELLGKPTRSCPRGTIDICPDYCNNWNDLMPLVVEHGISMSKWLDDGYYSIGLKMKYKADMVSMEVANNENIKKALAECVLLVLQEKAK